MKGISTPAAVAIAVVIAVIVSCLATIALYQHVYHPKPVTKTVVKVSTVPTTSTVTTTVYRTVSTTIPTTVSIVSTKLVTSPVTKVLRVTKTSVSTATVTRVLTKTLVSSYTVTTTKTSVVPTTTTVVRVLGVTVKPIPVLYAKLFKMWNASRYIVVEDAEHQLFVLVPHGAPQPSKLFIDALIKGLGIKPRKVFVVRIPIRRAVFLSTTEVALLYRVSLAMKNLSVLNTIVGVSYGKWWIEPVKKLVEEKHVPVVASYSGVNYEKILALKPDVVFMYTGFPAMEKAMEKLESLGLVVAVDNEWLEHSYLARFEWIKFIAAFYGPRALETAIKVFNHVVSVHNELVTALRLYSEETGKHPTFIWFFPSLKWGIWAPKRDAYPIKYLESLGARYLLAPYVPPGGGSAPISKEVVAKVACKADVWIVSGSPPYIDSIDDIAKVLGSWVYKCPAVVHHRVYFYGPSYWQLGYAFTEIVLKDLASVMYPNAPVLRGYVRTFFHHLWPAHFNVSIGGLTIEYRGFYKVIEDPMGYRWVVVPFDLVDQVPKKVLSEAKGVITMPVKSVGADEVGFAKLWGLGMEDLVKAVAICNTSTWPPTLRMPTNVGCMIKSIDVAKLRKIGVKVFIYTENPFLNTSNVNEMISKGIAAIALPEPKILNLTIREFYAVAAILDDEELAQAKIAHVENVVSSIENVVKYVPKPWGPAIVIRGSYVIVIPRSAVIAQVARIAGISYPNVSRLQVMTIDQFAKAYGNASILIVVYPLATSKKLVEMYPALSSVKAVKEGSVITFRALYVATVFQAYPALVIKDLAAVVHPTLFPGYVVKYFVKG